MDFLGGSPGQLPSCFPAVQPSRSPWLEQALALWVAQACFLHLETMFTYSDESHIFLMSGTV